MGFANRLLGIEGVINKTISYHGLKVGAIRFQAAYFIV